MIFHDIIQPLRPEYLQELSGNLPCCQQKNYGLRS